MQTLRQWAERWRIDPRAYQELLQSLGAVEQTNVSSAGLKTETGLQQAVTLEATRRGARVWRNNSGACFDPETGREIRYGLGNVSKQVNNVMKSSDLVGITPTRCTCGVVHGIFTAYEIKKPGWKLQPSDKRAQAQLNFIKLVISLGGIARFISDLGDLDR